MSALVPWQRGLTNASDVVVGAPVRQITWDTTAGIVNYVRGLGAMLVPPTLLQYTVPAGATRTFRFRVQPGNTSRRRVWLIGLRSGFTFTQSVTVTVPSAGTPYDFAANYWYANQQICQIFDDHGSSSLAEIDLDFDVTANGLGIEVAWCACYEMPMAFLDVDNAALGCDQNTVRVGDPIFNAPDGQSFNGVAVAQDDARNNNGRRVGQFAYFDPDGLLTTSATFAPTLDLPVTVLNRKLFTGETQRNLRWRVYASASSSAGEVRLTDSFSGDVQTVAVSSSTPQWWPSGPTPASILVMSEDMTANDGLQGGIVDEILVEQRSTAGNVRVFGISLWEDSADCS